MLLVMIHMTVIIWTKITEVCIILTVLYIFIITDVVSNN